MAILGDRVIRVVTGGPIARLPKNNGSTKLENANFLWHKGKPQLQLQRLRWMVGGSHTAKTTANRPVAVRQTEDPILEDLTVKKFLSAVAFSLVTVGLLSVTLMCPMLSAEAPQADANKQSAEKKIVGTDTVQLIIDYGDGVRKHFHQINWKDKMTVQDVTVAASKHPRGIQIKQRGKKATAFLSQIDDLANNPRGRSWVYRVNGKLADRSFGVYPVHTGDIVTWSFQAYP